MLTHHFLCPPGLPFHSCGSWGCDHFHDARIPETVWEEEMGSREKKGELKTWIKWAHHPKFTALMFDYKEGKVGLSQVEKKIRCVGHLAMVINGSVGGETLPTRKRTDALARLAEKKITRMRSFKALLQLIDQIKILSPLGKKVIKKAYSLAESPAQKRQVTLAVKRN